jgi:two-component system, OmpR family, sensor histidine kinase KdpD
MNAVLRSAALKGFLLALFVVTLATGLSGLLETWLPTANISVVYLIAVLIVAMRAGLKPAILATVLGFLAFNFFFTEPRWTLAIADTSNILTVILFLVAAFIVSNMAGRLRDQIEETRESERRAANLYDFSSRLTGALEQDDVLWAVVHHVAVIVRGHSVVLLPNRGALAIAASYPPEDELDETSLRAAQFCWDTGVAAGRGTRDLPGSLWLFMPMRTARSAIGVLGVQQRRGADKSEGPASMVLLSALADQGAVAIERAMLMTDIETTRISVERERLRAALLSSLSHDLRTPLSSVLGAASSLLNDDTRLSGDSRRELAQTIQEEAERLNRFVQDLLDMTKLGSGALKPRIDWTDLRDIVGAAVSRARRVSSAHAIDCQIGSELPLVCVDAVLMEQVVFNLLDNAFKYSPAAAPIRIVVGRSGDCIFISVADSGPGIAVEDREKVFDMFYRISQEDSQTAGTGLGLAICRGIVEAHGGSIVAEPGPTGIGTRFVVSLPFPKIADPAPRERDT